MVVTDRYTYLFDVKLTSKQKERHLLDDLQISNAGGLRKLKKKLRKNCECFVKQLAFK